MKSSNLVINKPGVPLVSILTSVYNGEAYIANCIESILGQTFQDFEFVIVDDGSTDGTWEIIQKFAVEDRRIAAVQCLTNQGVVAGLNRGLSKTRGQYIARQDADDMSRPERLAKQVDFLNTHREYGVVACQVTYIDSANRPVNQASTFNTIDNAEIQQKLLEYMCLCGPSIMMRRQSVEAAGFWFGEGLDASEDYDLCLRLSEVTKLFNLPEPLYMYRLHAQSASIKQEYKQIVHKATALENAVRRRGKNHIDRAALATLGKDYLKAAVLAYTNKDAEATREAMVKATEADPFILENSDLIERVIRYRMPDEVDLAIPFVCAFFTTFLPQSPELKRLNSRLISEIHMKEVFVGAQLRERKRVKLHLWEGLRLDPRWLKNRGVLMIALKYGLI